LCTKAIDERFRNLASVKVREPKKRDLLTPTRVSVPAGAEGYKEFPFTVEEIKPQ
jgi:hypothetical protein